MRKEISQEHSVLILEKMCAMIGLSYDAVKFIQPNWFELHTWTLEEEKEFIEWLARFLIDHKYVRPRWKQAIHEAEKINMNYGWKTEPNKYGKDNRLERTS